MDPARWRRIEEIFHAAVVRAPGDRDSFLAGACGGDDELKRVVQGLLAVSTNGEFEGLALADAVNRLARPAANLTGRRLGVYQIEAKVGAGGMGEVYKARDTRLGRDVAIKVLPQAFASDASRLARFEREARMLAALNHPHIAAIHGFEELDGVPGLILELVDGPTLAERIARGPLPVQEALAVAQQIAEALEAAHEQGIVHRDLKPANVKLVPSGDVKVLDFGLAKALAPADASQQGSPSAAVTSAFHTGVGVLLGTAAYMSPEQARGEAVDRRTDIWAFGCVLYEMLTGCKAFDAPTVTETLAKILEGHADLGKLPTGTPPAIARLVRRCLEHSPRNRVQHIGDARADVEDVRAAETAERGTARTASQAMTLVWVAAASGLALLVSAGVWFMATRVSSGDSTVVPIRFDVARVAAQASPATRTLALSPDGSRLVYAANSSLRLRAIGGDDLPLPARGEMPFFSPDGQWLAFFSENGLHRMPAGGGGVQLITAARPGRERPYGGTWGSDGTIVVARGGGLFRVSAQGGDIQRVADPDTAAGEVFYGWPEFLPGGRSVVFTIVTTAGLGEARVAVVDLATRQQKIILHGGHAARYVPTGHLLYATGGQLQAVGFDPVGLETHGVPVTVDGVTIGSGIEGSTADFHVSDNGTLAYAAPARSLMRTMAWVDRAGREEPIPAPSMAYIYPRISPDGTRVALDIGGTGRDIWVWHFARGVITQISKGPTEDLMPAWTPDGARVYYGSNRAGGTFRIFSVDADGAGAEREEFAGPVSYMPLQMRTRDALLAFASGTGSPQDVVVLSLADRQARTLVGGAENQGVAEVSPDGRLIAYGEDGAPKVNPEVIVRTYPDVDRRREQISLDGGIQPLWGPAGSNELFYWTLNGRLKVVSVTSNPDLRVGTARDVPLSAGYETPIAGTSWVYAVSPVDGRFLLFKRVPGTGALAPIKVVVNWQEELKRLVPTR